MTNDEKEQLRNILQCFEGWIDAIIRRDADMLRAIRNTIVELIAKANAS